MSYLTDRKRAEGLGSAKSGTMHHWHLMVSSVALLGLIFFFVFVIGRAIGMPYAEARLYMAQPFPAIVSLLTVLVGFYHFKEGVQTPIEDYARHGTQRVLLIVSILLSYGLMALAAFSIIRLAL